MLIHAVFHPRGQGRLPTLIALHGHGANALDLLGLAPFIAGGRLLMICPQAELEAEQGLNGYTWFRRRPDGSLPLDELEHSVAVARAFIDTALDRYPVDRSRLALLGFSQGGMLGYRLALSQPHRFVGFAALSTALSWQDDAPLVPGDGVSGLPVLVQHGRDDPLISVERAQQSCERLRTFGVKPEYLEYAMGHQIGSESGRDLSLWLERVLKLPVS